MGERPPENEPTQATLTDAESRAFSQRHSEMIAAKCAKTDSGPLGRDCAIATQTAAALTLTNCDCGSTLLRSNPHRGVGLPGGVLPRGSRSPQSDPHQRLGSTGRGLTHSATGRGGEGQSSAERSGRLRPVEDRRADD